MKPQHRLLLAAAVIFGVALLYMSLTNGDVGTVSRTDTGITQIYSKADGDQTVAIPIQLQEGSDVEHESSHVFDVLNGMIGVERATIALDGTRIDVRYSSSEASEENIRNAYVASGYAPAQ